MSTLKGFHRAAIIMLFAVVLAGCAGSGDTTSISETPQPRTERCLRISDIDNWRVVDNRQLVVYGQRKDDAWHLRLFASCTDLSFSETVAFRARGSTLLCGDPGDEIITRGGRCPIASMRRIDAVGIAELFDPNVRKDIGKLPPRDNPTPTGNHQENQ